MIAELDAVGLAAGLQGPELQARAADLDGAEGVGQQLLVQPAQLAKVAAVAGVGGEKDVGRVLDAGDGAQLAEGLLAVEEVEAAVQLDAAVFGQLGDGAAEGSVGEADDAAEGGWFGVAEELTKNRVAGL